MLRIGCVFLAVCLVLISFASCSRVPREAETIYPCVEGRRIPFEVLLSGENYKDFGCILIRNRKDVDKAIENEWISNLAYRRLKKVNYHHYAVVCISTWTNPFIPGTVIEILDQDGNLGVVYESLWQEGAWSGDLDVKRTHSYAFLLVRKKDLEGMKLGEKLEVPCTEYICYLYDPERFFVKQ